MSEPSVDTAADPPAPVARPGLHDSHTEKPAVRVLVVGQTPPPYHGQALAIEMMLRGRYRHAQLTHVRIAFSTEIGQVGRFAWRKIGHLAATIVRIYWVRIRHRVTVLYYPPAGPDVAPMLRDLVILISVRWLFRRTILHFHITGVSTLLTRLPAPLRVLFRAAYFRADVAVYLSANAPQDGTNLISRREVVVPNAVEDHASSYSRARDNSGWPPTILFVGALTTSKGVSVLLDACALLQQRGLDFRLKLVGDFASHAFEQEVRHSLDRNGLITRVDLTGVLIGSSKWQAYADADIFCLPSLFEAQGLVLLEAMQFSLPIVATLCGGIPSTVEDGLNGFLVRPEDPIATADRLATLVLDADLRARLGTNGRLLYERRYTPQRFYDDFDCLFASLAG